MTPVTVSPSPWTRRFPPSAQAPARLFVLPRAGGGAGWFHPWSQALAGRPAVVRAPCPAGRDRLRERCAEDLGGRAGPVPAEITAQITRLVADAAAGRQGPAGGGAPARAGRLHPTGTADRTGKAPVTSTGRPATHRSRRSMDTDIVTQTGTDAPDSPAAGTATEDRLRRVWARLLRHEEIGPDAEFFASGGSSLLASRLLLRVRREFGVQLTLEEVYAHPTLRRMAALVDAGAAGKDMAA
ncbi:phosphopantetheine-binding protein [Streptomyces sp. DT190]|uniref:phosphopantetheine-binding protein n=1 Tax=unclassified Streptomyces TaxID=2593676 RepID=UPI003CFACC7A